VPAARRKKGLLILCIKLIHRGRGVKHFFRGRRADSPGRMPKAFPQNNINTGADTSKIRKTYKGLFFPLPKRANCQSRKRYYNRDGRRPPIRL
jgi:hypothetical protein